MRTFRKWLDDCAYQIIGERVNDADLSVHDYELPHLLWNIRYGGEGVDPYSIGTIGLRRRYKWSDK